MIATSTSGSRFPPRELPIPLKVLMRAAQFSKTPESSSFRESWGPSTSLEIPGGPWGEPCRKSLGQFGERGASPEEGPPHCPTDPRSLPSIGMASWSSGFQSDSSNNESQRSRFSRCGKG